MTSSTPPAPPRWADALLRLSLRPSDRDSTSGDLLEEYREARHPSLGTVRANLWYVTQVASVVWRLARPSALALMALTIASLAVSGLVSNPYVWYGSLAPAPGLSLVHTLIYLWAGHHAFTRTRLVGSGSVAAGLTSLFGFIVLFTGAAVGSPGLLLAPFDQPFIFVILALLLLMALSYGALAGALGAAIGRWTGPAASRRVWMS